MNNLAIDFNSKSQIYLQNARLGLGVFVSLSQRGAFINFQGDESLIQYGILAYQKNCKDYLCLISDGRMVDNTGIILDGEKVSIGNNFLYLGNENIINEDGKADENITVQTQC